MKLASVEIRGRRSMWGINWHATPEQIAAMRADGIEVYEIENTIPTSIAGMGLTRAWCFLQDLWNLKNPFRF